MARFINTLGEEMGENHRNMIDAVVRVSLP